MTEIDVPELVRRLGARVEEMVELLGTLVTSESPSNDPALLAATAELIADRGSDLLGVKPERIIGAGAPALRWSLPGLRCGGRPVLVLAHLDTVWPAGTIARWPFSVDGDRASGPGAFDMKGGLVQALFALAALGETDLDRPPVVVLVTADEEIGSPGGREIIESVARDVSAVLVLEASETGRLKVARKGVSNYDLHVTGRSAHAGLEPEKGINALVAAAGLVLEVEALAAPELGTTVTPTTATAGTTRNTVPAAASVALDVRAATTAEQQRVDDGIRALHCANGAKLTIEGGVNRPPLEEESSSQLLALARRAAERCGLGPVDVARVGGGSDGNLTAALGVPTLDGLGAVGAGAHAEGEYVLVSSMPERAALLAALIVEIGRELR
jgi:glutamate carboxypeptidase